jgi:hypothetical protein
VYTSLAGWMLADAGGNWLCSKEAKTLFSPIPYNPEQQLEIHFFFAAAAALAPSWKWSRPSGNRLADAIYSFLFFFFHGIPRHTHKHIDHIDSINQTKISSLFICSRRTHAG